MKLSVKTIHGIEIIFPDLKYFKKIEKALNFLRREDKKSFEKVTNHLDIIFIYTKEGFYNEIRESKDSSKWGWLVEGSAIIEESYPYQFIASELIHEAQHVIQYKSNRRYTVEQAELGSYIVQRRFLKKIKYENAIKWLEDFYKEKWWLDKHRGGKQNRIKKSEEAVSIFNRYVEKKLEV